MGGQLFSKCLPRVTEGTLHVRVTPHTFTYLTKLWPLRLFFTSLTAIDLFEGPYDP